MSDKPVVFLCFANARKGPHGYLRNLAEEARRVQEVLTRAEKDGLCEVVVHQNVTASQVFDVFQEYRNRIAIFHFGGHAGNYELLLESRDGSSASASAPSLAAFLGQQQGIQLVFLNGCSTEPQVMDLLRAGVSSVIATSQAIDDQVATEFAVRFYRGLTSGASLSTAYAEAESAAHTEHGGQVRGVILQEVNGQPVPEPLAESWPWQLRYREGAESVREWNLPDAADDPLYLLPKLPAIDLPQEPFRNILWFERKDAPIFFGRGYEISALYQKLTAPDGSPVILYYGQSGVGKSSILAAGLLPRLEQEQRVAYARREVTTGLLGTLVATLHTEAAQPLAEPVAANSVSTAPDAQSMADASAAGEQLRLLWLNIEQQRGMPLTILLDQVEEAYTRPRKNDEPDEMPRLVEAIVAIFNNIATRPKGRLVLTFRKEWLAEIVKLLATAHVPRTTLYLERLERRGVLEAISGPAREGRLKSRYNLHVEEDLAERIATDLLADSSSAVAPTLQILLDRMWQAAKKLSHEKPTFDSALYDDLKRKGLLLSDFLRQQLEELKRTQADAVKSGLALDLLAYHTTGLGTAQERALAEVQETYAHRQDDLPALLQACRDLYLLVDPRANLPDAEPASRLAHDTLAPLVRQDYEHSDAPGQRARRIIENRGVEWEDGRDGNTLDDEDLALVEAGRSGMRDLSADEQHMFDASKEEIAQRLAEEAQREQEREEAKLQREQALLNEAAATARAEQQQKNAGTLRRRAWLLAGAALLAVILAGTAAYFWRDADIGRTAEAAARGTAEALQASEAQARSIADVDREIAVEAQATAVAAKAEVDRLTRGIRADQLTANGLTVVYEDPQLALLLGVEGLRALHDFTRTQPYTLTQITYDLAQSSYITTSTILTREVVAGRAHNNLRTLLDAVGGVPLVEHTSTVNSVVFSPDGQWLATASDDGSARLWDLTADNPGADPIILQGWNTWPVSAIAFSSDGHWLATEAATVAHLWDLTADDLAADPIILQGHAATISTLAFSTDGRWLATGSWDTTARLWDLISDNPGADPIILHGHGDRVLDVEFSANGRWLATASFDDTARLWDLTATDPSAEPIILQGHEYWINALAFSADSHWLATGSYDDTARLWDLTAADPGADPIILQGHADSVEALAFSADGHWLATGSWDITARLWDLTADDPSADPIVLQGHTDSVYAVAFSPNGQWLATASGDHTARLWDLTAAEQGTDPIIMRGHEDDIISVAFSPDGRWLATGSLDNTPRLWDLTGGDPSADSVTLQGHADIVNAIAFSPDGQWLATGSQDNTARLWDLTADEPSTDSVVLQGHTNWVYALAFSADGHWLATGSADNTARLWDLTADDPSADAIVLQGHAREVYAVAFSPDGEWLATGSHDATARLWDLTAADPAADPIVLQGHAGPVYAVAFSPDGQWLVTGSYDETARLWDLRAADPAADPIILHGHAGVIFAVAFSHDSRWLATASGDRTARVWDLTADDPSTDPIVLHGHRDVIFAVAFSVDGHWLATGAHDTIVLLWDLTADNPSEHVNILEGHTDGVNAFAFSADGRWLATGSADDTARLWDLTADDPGADPVILQGHTETVWSVAFSPDSHWLATGSYDKTARLWRVDVDAVIAEACSRIGRNLTLDEWQRYLGDQEYHKTCPQWRPASGLEDQS